MKRKSNARDSRTSENAAIYDELGTLHRVLSQDEEEFSSDKSELDNFMKDGYFRPDQEIGEGSAESDSEDFTTEGEAEASDSEDEFSKITAVTSGKYNGIENDQREPVNGRAVGENEDHEPNFAVTQDANGNLRYIYADIDPVYDSDDSDAPATTNTIGSIPLSFYDSYPHIGYTIDGKKVMRPAKGAALDSLLDSIELPQGWTGLTDPSTGTALELNREELEMLKRITGNEVPGNGYDPYPEMLELFTNQTEVMPLSAAPEPKRRFVPSKHEAKRVMKIVKAIKEGRIRPYRQSSGQEEEDADIQRYDIWADEAPRPDHPMNVPAPKLPPPGYDESYHPPPEYLPGEDERKAWLESEDEERSREYLPSNHDSLRKVPGYENFVKEKFERCLDLYLAPRIRRSKLNIDPESLLPKLPTPEELKPFPNRCDIIFLGHKGRVRSLAISPRGDYLASAGDDGTVRVWDMLDGRQLWSVTLQDREPVDVIRWRPNKDSLIISAAVGENVYLMVPLLPSLSQFTATVEDTYEITSSSHETLNVGWAAQKGRSTSSAEPAKESLAKWSRPDSALQEIGVLVKITVRATVKVIAWHRKGDYFSTVSPQGQSNAIAIHTLSKHLTQLPFRRLKGLAQSVQFHPSKPIFFVATQRTIRSYDLMKQELVKVLQTGARWISSFDVHAGGDNLIIGSYDRRLLWFDLDLSPRPYKTLRYHQRAIRAVRYHHGGFPLFADASDDGTVQVFHGKVFGDLMENANIVPLKVLRGHRAVNGLGVLDIDWHPTSPWCVSAGADGTCRLWMD